jgi:hypothetical protein
MVRRSVPASSRWTAKACRSECGATGLLIPHCARTSRPRPGPARSRRLPARCRPDAEQSRNPLQHHRPAGRRQDGLHRGARDLPRPGPARSRRLPARCRPDAEQSRNPLPRHRPAGRRRDGLHRGARKRRFAAAGTRQGKTNNRTRIPARFS